MWRTLKKGSLVDIVAPASRCPLDEIEKGIKVLESWGLRVRVPTPLFGNHWTHSNNDQVRIDQLKAAIEAPDSDAIWVVRGGYGSLKLLPALSKMRKPRVNKVFLGLSDVTSLHLFFNQKWGWSTLHAPILSRVGRGDLPPKSINELKQILFGKRDEQVFSVKPLNLFAKNINAQKNKKSSQQNSILRGQLVGGNLATFQTCLGTPFEWKPKNTILFLEDVGERAYRLDRMWEHLLQTGLLQKCSGIILGDFTDGLEADGRNLFPQFLKERAETCPVPLFTGLPVGHGKIQRTLPLGVQVCIENNKLIVPSGFYQDLKK